MSKKIKLTLQDQAALEARGARIHSGNACIFVEGLQYVMEGKTGRHTLLINRTTLERLNEHWVSFAKENAYKAA